jgi:hypothetical protein
MHVGASSPNVSEMLVAILCGKYWLGYVPLLQQGEIY